jgi:hypothetical protein
MIQELIKKGTIEYKEFEKVTDSVFDQLNISNRKQWLKSHFGKKSRALLDDEEGLKLLLKLEDMLEAPVLSVVNGYKEGFEGDGIMYIGRKNHDLFLEASPLANPFPLKNESDRTEVIEKYRRWLFERIKANDEKVMGALNILKLAVVKKRRVRLACYCHPKLCHGDVIIKCVDWLIASRR